MLLVFLGGDGAALQNAFQFITTEKSFTVVADSPQDKAFWLNDLRAALGHDRNSTSTSIGPRGNLVFPLSSSEAPVWVPDKMAARCMCCGATFTVIRRKVCLPHFFHNHFHSFHKQQA